LQLARWLLLQQLFILFTLVDSSIVVISCKDEY